MQSQYTKKNVFLCNLVKMEQWNLEEQFIKVTNHLLKIDLFSDPNSSFYLALAKASTSPASTLNFVSAIYNTWLW